MEVYEELYKQIKRMTPEQRYQHQLKMWVNSIPDTHTTLFLKYIREDGNFQNAASRVRWELTNT